jgi:hypothetical protein
VWGTVGVENRYGVQYLHVAFNYIVEVADIINRYVTGIEATNN